MTDRYISPVGGLEIGRSDKAALVLVAAGAAGYLLARISVVGTRYQDQARSVSKASLVLGGGKLMIANIAAHTQTTSPANTGSGFTPDRVQ